MNKNSLRHFPRPLRSLSTVAVLGALLLAEAHAGDLGILRGKDGDYRNMMLAYDSGTFWRRDFSAGTLDVRLEASLGRVAAPGGTSPDALWHAGLAPVARYWFTPNTGLEYGLGARLFSGTRLGDKTISTAFQFENSLGVFHRFGGTPWTLGLRFSHYSNADIKRPNPGQDYWQLRLGYTLD